MEATAGSDATDDWMIETDRLRVGISPTRRGRRWLLCVIARG